MIMDHSKITLKCCLSPVCFPVVVFEIAGKGTADESSFREALFTAIQIYKKRQEYDGLTANVLKVSPKKTGGRGRHSRS